MTKLVAHRTEGRRAGLLHRIGRQFSFCTLSRRAFFILQLAIPGWKRHLRFLIQVPDAAQKLINHLGRFFEPRCFVEEAMWLTFRVVRFDWRTQRLTFLDKLSRLRVQPVFRAVEQQRRRRFFANMQQRRNTRERRIVRTAKELVETLSAQGDEVQRRVIQNHCVRLRRNRLVVVHGAHPLREERAGSQMTSR